MEGRYFGGKKYYFNKRFDNKREANGRASRLRKEGNLARVETTSNGYVVWDRPK